MNEQLTSLRRLAETYRTLAADHRDVAKELVEFKDESPVGFEITNGELYHANLRNAERFEGMAYGVEKAIQFLVGGGH